MAPCSQTGMVSIGVAEPESICRMTRTGITRRPNCPIEAVKVAAECRSR